MRASERFTHQVRKPLPAEGGKLLTGLLVDASGWRNATKLAEQGYLEPVHPGLEAFVDEQGNAWADEKWAERASVAALTEQTALDAVLPSYPRHDGFGLWTLSDGSTIGRCKREEAEAAEAAL
jgi:hypothetical protein